MTTKKNSEQAAIAGVLNRLAKDNPLISTDQLQKKIKSEWKKGTVDNEEEKIIIDQVAKSSDQEIVTFVTEKITSANWRDKLSLPIVEAIVERFFVFMENFLAKYNQSITHDLSQDLAWTLEHAVQLNEVRVDYFSPGQRPESITDKAYQSALNLYRKHSEVCLVFMNCFGQDCQTVRPDILIDGIAKMFTERNIDNNFKLSLLHSFNYVYAFFRDIYDQEIIKALDFKNPKNFARTGIFLEFLKKLYNLSGDQGFSKQNQAFIIRHVEKAIEQKEGSYLLKLRAQDLLAGMDEWENISERRRRGKILQKYNQNYEIYELARGVKANYDYDKNDLYVLKQDKEKEQTFVPITIEDIRLNEKAEVSREEDKNFLNDFIYLSKPEIRAHIEKDLQIDIRGLSLTEQAYFLQVLKNRDQDEIAELRTFTDLYGHNGFRTFLSLESGELSGDDIINIGKKLQNKPDLADKLFAEYARLVDSAAEETKKIIKMYDDLFPGYKIKQNQVVNAILKKAVDLLVRVSQKFGNAQEIEKESIIEDLIKDLERYDKIKQKSIENLMTIKKFGSSATGNICFWHE